MTEKKRLRPTRGWMPIPPEVRNPSHRRVWMIASITVMLIAGSTYFLFAQTPAGPIFPELPSEYAGYDAIRITGDLEGWIVPVMTISENPVLDVHCRANWHVDPGLHVPVPPTLTFTGPPTLWKGTEDDFSGYHEGADFELNLQWSGVATLGFWWSTSDGSSFYKLTGKGLWTLVEEDALIVSVELSDVAISSPREGHVDQGYLTLWEATRPIELSIHIQPMEPLTGR